jgi:hypothetical protein
MPRAGLIDALDERGIEVCSSIRRTSYARADV